MSARGDARRAAPPAPPGAPAPTIIVGAGLAGLAAAWRLHRAGRQVIVLDAATRVGGFVDTVDIGGHLFEAGPNTVMSTAEHLAQLIDEVGLRERVIESHDAAAKRLVWFRGALHRVPGGPGALLITRLMSVRGKLRLLAEPLIRGPREAGDETLEALLTRRLGKEAVAALADPFVTGVFAGRIDELGTDAMPLLAEFEREHGGLFRGMIARGRAKRRASVPRQRRRRSRLISFPRGLRELPRALHRALGARVRLEHEVRALAPLDGVAGARWRVLAFDGGREVVYEAADVVLAVPAWAAGRLLEGLAAEEACYLRSLPHPHVASIGLGLRRADVGHPLDAFGLLRASSSPLPTADPILGVLFTSSIFDGRAPEDAVTISVMIGGASDPESRALSDGALVDRARQAVGELLAVRGEPSAVFVSRWPRGIPQYPPGHLRHISALREALARTPGIALAGNYLEGVGLEPSVASGMAAADALLAPLAPSEPG